MLTIETDGDVLFVKALGAVSHEDYQSVLVPAVERAIDEHGKVKLLYWLGAEFERLTAGAMWDDAKMGAVHLGDFSRVAVVTDAAFIRGSVGLFAPLIRAPVKVFANSDIAAARSWITEDSNG